MTASRRPLLGTLDTCWYWCKRRFNIDAGTCRLRHFRREWVALLTVSGRTLGDETETDVVLRVTSAIYTRFPCECFVPFIRMALTLGEAHGAIGEGNEGYCELLCQHLTQRTRGGEK